MYRKYLRFKVLETLSVCLLYIYCVSIGTVPKVDIGGYWVQEVQYLPTRNRRLLGVLDIV